MRELLSLMLVVCVGCGPSGAGGTGGANGGAGGHTGTGGSGGQAPPGSTLEILPADQTVIVASGARANVDYVALLHTPGQSDSDVTTNTVFSVDNSALGNFAGAHFTGAVGAMGTTVVHGSEGGISAQTNLTLGVQSVVIGPGAPGDAPGRFGGSIDPSRAPTIVYPTDGVLLPPNLNDFEFHYMPGNGNTLFRLSVRQGAVALDMYFGCQAVGGGCVFSLDQATWMILAESLRGAPMATYTLAGVDGGNPGAVGVSAQQRLAVADLNITGGLYYWNAGAGSVRRYDFGLRGQTAENYMDAARAGATQCVGCHVLSRDGHKIAVGMDIPAPSPYKVFDVATRGTIYQQGSMFGGGGSNFFSFSPDGMQVLTSNGVNIAWRDAASGSAIMDPLVSTGAMPDWSPDGMKMVYARPQTAPPCIGGFCGATGVDAADIEIMSFNGSNWSASAPLVGFGGQNNYYPSFSPDGGWVLFNRSPSNHNSYDAPDAQVWAVSQAGGSEIRLANASTGVNGDSWPKWAPILQSWQQHPILWFTFSSRRAYGLRIAAGAHAQIWMAAFDPTKAQMGQDASLPAFWLPFQEPDSGNHIAQMVLHVDRMPCINNTMCATGEFCVGGQCIPMPM